MGGSFSIVPGESQEDMTRGLQARQTLLTVLIATQGLGVFYMICQTLVPGYAVVTTPSGSTAVPHAIWLLAPFFASLTCALLYKPEVGLYKDTMTLGFYYCYGVLGAAIVANAIGLGFFIWELYQGVSNFATQEFGFLVATVIVTALFIAVELFTIGALYVYQRDLMEALRHGWKPVFTDHDPMYEVTNDKKEPLLPTTSNGGNKTTTNNNAQLRTRLVK